MLAAAGEAFLLAAEAARPAIAEDVARTVLVKAGPIRASTMRRDRCSPVVTICVTLLRLPASKAYPAFTPSVEARPGEDRDRDEDRRRGAARQVGGRSSGGEAGEHGGGEEELLEHRIGSPKQVRICGADELGLAIDHSPP